MNKLLSMIKCNAETIIMFVVRDLLIGGLVTCAGLGLMAAVDVSPSASIFEIYVGVTLSLSAVMCLLELCRHKRDKYGVIEKRQFMTPRLRAQLHDVVMTATTYLVVGAIFAVLFFYGLAKSLLSGFLP